MAKEVDYSRVTIQPDEDMLLWWGATKNKVFNLGLCLDCDNKYFPPWPGCGKCSSTNVGLIQIEGKGWIYSYNVVTQPIVGHMTGAIPYIHAIIEIPEGNNIDGSKTRIGGLILDDEDQVGIGSEVRLLWVNHPNQDYKIPTWEITGQRSQEFWQFPG